MLTRDAYTAAVSELLEARENAAPHRKVWRSDVADAVNVSTDSVKNWVCGVNGPDAVQLLNLCAYFGPTFTREVLALIGQNGDTLAEQAIKDELRPHLQAALKVVGT